MADNEKAVDCAKQERRSKQSGISKTKDRANESHLPTPPPSPWDPQSARTQPEMTQMRSLEEDEDIITYLTDLGAAFEGQTSECPSRNSTTSAMAVTGLSSDEMFEPLSRLYALTEQILELRKRNSRLFKRVRNLEKLKVLRDADRRLENSFAQDRYPDVRDEDTEFAESLLNAMLSNYREPQFQRRNVRSPSARQPRSKLTVEKQISTDETARSAPKISKWTKVKAAFKWERACTNDTETADVSASTKYLRIPDSEIRNSVNEGCDSAKPSGQASPASSFNEGSFDCPQKAISNYLESPSPKIKEGKKEQYTSQRIQSFDSDVTLRNERGDDVENTNEVDQGKPAIQITSKKNQLTPSSSEVDRGNAEEMSKRPTLSLTITIPSHEEEIRCMSSPESNSPFLSSVHTSGGNSPQYKKMYQELSSSKDFKQQQSLVEEPITPTSRTQRQDSKWDKVRRAFLTNSTLSVPPSPIRVISRQMLLQDGQEAPLTHNYSNSMEHFEKITALNAQVDTQRGYNALREKLGVEFHRKLIEWERLKNLSPRVGTKDTCEGSAGLSNPRENLLSEERLAPEFRKKLQEWKRAKKERRGSAPLEQQRLNRRRLTDWQVWRSPSKSECKVQEPMGSRASYGSKESIFNDGRSRLFEDFVRKMETWKKVNETSNLDTKHPAMTNSNRLKLISGIDESEFVALEKALSFFDNNAGKDQQEGETRQVDECFNGDTRSYIDSAQQMNTNEVFIRTPVGAYRFEGISQEFTRKLYDWEKYRGISPKSSTFRLLGPAYIPLEVDTNIEIPTSTTNEIENNEQVLFKTGSLKRSKSVNSLIKRTIQDDYLVRRCTSLPSLDYLIYKLKNDHIDTLPVSINPQGVENTTEDIVIDDSEPEAMIVDIEDVIEETASPLKGVQPHQTPVYSVATSETTSIAVPLGTVASTHEPSPVFLVEIAESSNQNQRESNGWNSKRFLSEDSPSVEQFETSKTLSHKENSLVQDDINSARLLSKKNNYVDNSFDYLDKDLNKDFVKPDNWMKLDEEYKMSRKSEKIADQDCGDIERRRISPVISDEENITKTEFDGTNENETIHRRNLGNRSPFVMSIKKSTDSPSEKEYEQENEGQRANGDGCNVDEKDDTEVEMKCDNEYEEITPSTISDPYCRFLTDCSKYPSNFLPESSQDCRLGETNRILFNMNLRQTNQVNEDLKRHEENNIVKNELDHRNTCYSLSKIKIDSQLSEKQNSRIVETSTSAKPMKTKEWQQQYKFENIPMSSMLRAKDSSIQEYHCEPTIRTTSLTVAACREERCFERIIINEETLNKIVVPTASNNCTENAKLLKPPIDYSTDKHFIGEHHQRLNISRETSVGQEANIKKQSSPTRNVFIKTKRMIFSPFRRMEDHSIDKKENNALEENHALSTRSKSKSRSTSPKISRQDALLKMSFSLPWPLRLSSKDRELKETTVTDYNEGPMEVDNKRRSLFNENKVSQRSHVQQKLQSLKDKWLEKENGDIKHLLGHQKVRVTPDEQQNSSSATSSLFTLPHEERKSESVSSSRSDTPSSDLMHKLQILSSVVAERDNRVSMLSGESCLESHFLRIRRAKEDFLSRRGGPLCHSVMEIPSSNDHHFPKISVHHYEQISQDQQNMEDKVLKVEETLNECEAKMAGTKLPTDEDVVFLPDRVKSASAGMINVDPDTFKRLTETNRGCESLPRTTAKQQEPSGSLAKIVNKFKFARLIRSKDIEEGNMSTISRLCKQSLLIDLRNEFKKQWEAKDREE